MMGIEALFNHVFALSRPTRTDDGQGGWAVGYADAGSVAGRLRPASASERTAAVQRQATISHVFYCGPNADVRREDLVSGAGQVVKVEAVREPSHAGHHLEIECLEIQKAGEQEAGS